MIEEYFYNSDEEIEKQELTSYQNGKLKEKEISAYHLKKESKITLIMTYDERENVIKISSFDSAGKQYENTRSYIFEYDSLNNYVKEIEYYNGIPKFITERNIKYYE